MTEALVREPLMTCPSIRVSLYPRDVPPGCRHRPQSVGWNCQPGDRITNDLSPYPALTGMGLSDPVGAWAAADQ